ncbi:MAG: hypothetical protein WCP95_10130 [Actinomycetes bacterium]
MDSHEDIERLLPVTSWRGWLVAVAGLLVVVAAVLYASVDSRLVTVAGSGRVTDGAGIRLVSASVSGQLASIDVEDGDKVSVGQVVAHVVSGDSSIPQRTQNAGTVMGSLWRPGDPIKVGDWIMEIASSESDGKQALVSMGLSDGAKVQKGQSATVSVTGALKEPVGRTVKGTVSLVTPPLRAGDVELGLALLEQPTGKQIVVAITLDEAVQPGSVVDAVVTVSERNLLQQLLGQS